MNDLQIITKTEFVQKFDPVRMLTTFRHIKTTAQAIEADKNGISYYSQQFGEDAILAVIELHLIALCESVNVGQPLTKFQIKEIAIEILTMYYFLSVIEICYIFRRAKRGEFGQFYGVLNIVAILDWFRQYTDERVNTFVEKSTIDIQTDFSLRSEDRKILERHNKIKSERGPTEK